MVIILTASPNADGLTTACKLAAKRGVERRRQGDTDRSVWERDRELLHMRERMGPMPG